MINLYNILLEQLNGPKAIILAGAPGAGKGFILRGLNLEGLKVLNVDNIYINLLKKANVSLDLKNATPEERSKQAIAMAAANKEFKGEVASTIDGKESFILDGTAASVKQTTALNNELKEAGYDVFMLYVYTDLERSLKQNQDRFEKSGGEDRSLAPAIVLRTWLGVTKNYKVYKNMFGDNFISVANTLQDEKLKNVEDVVKKYLEPFKPTGTKPKTPSQQARSDKQKAEINAQVQTLLSDDGAKEIINNSVSKEEAQSKIKQFLSS
jgi:adenylate kinase family enzyme|tara:strand:- start:600 stop:1400 length:801 start_codon:yes stop_codon:yes gene_type:complete